MMDARRVAARRMRESLAVIVIVGAGVAYRLAPSVRRGADLFLDPAVAGISELYSTASTALYRRTGVDLGMVKPDWDPVFDERVNFARDVNERRAAPLIDIAEDRRYPDATREQALKALLNFESPDSWVQQLLNELPKGGLIGLYERDTPTLDALFERIRVNGGVRGPLAGDYAELVFSFMLQVPDSILRSHALHWLNDALPENALSLIVSRIEIEGDPDVRKAIEQALLDVRVVPKPEAAAAALLPYFKNPPWDTLKVPVAVVLARLGDRVSADFLRRQKSEGGLSPDEASAIDVALGGTPYPTTPEGGPTTVAARHAQERHSQTVAALLKRDKLERQAKLSRELVAKAMDPDQAPYVHVRPEIDAPAPEKPLAMTLPVDKPFLVAADAPLYTGPGEGRQTRALPKGTLVTADLEATAGGRTWYEVNTSYGARWIDAAALTAPEDADKVSESAPAEGNFLEVAEDDVPVFERPSTDAQIVAKLAKGNIVEVQKSEKVASERWFEIPLKDDQTGWIRGDLNLRLTAEPKK